MGRGTLRKFVSTGLSGGQEPASCGPPQKNKTKNQVLTGPAFPLAIWMLSGVCGFLSSGWWADVPCASLHLNPMQQAFSSLCQALCWEIWGEQSPVPALRVLADEEKGLCH